MCKVEVQVKMISACRRVSLARDAGVYEDTTTRLNDLHLASIPLTQATEADHGEWVSDPNMLKVCLPLKPLCYRYPKGMTSC